MMVIQPPKLSNTEASTIIPANFDSNNNNNVTLLQDDDNNNNNNNNNINVNNNINKNKNNNIDNNNILSDEYDHHSHSMIPSSRSLHEDDDDDNNNNNNNEYEENVHLIDNHVANDLMMNCHRRHHHSRSDTTNPNIHHITTTTSSSSVMTIEEAMELVGYGPFQYGILLAIGLAFMADAMETMILSFLPHFIIHLNNSNNNDESSWSLSSSWITSVVFIGSFVGSLTLVPMADMIGRRIIFLLSTGCILSIFSILTSLCTNIVSLLLCRFMVGIGIGCLTTIHDIWIEFLPSKHRGHNMIWIGYFWNIGIVAVPIVAHIIVSINTNNRNNTSSLLGDDTEHQNHHSSSNDWRLFLFICSLPCVVSTIIGYYYLPESPRWLLSKHWNEKNNNHTISTSSLLTTTTTMNYHERAVQILRIAEEINSRYNKNNEEFISSFPSNVIIVPVGMIDHMIISNSYNDNDDGQSMTHVETNVLGDHQQDEQRHDLLHRNDHATNLDDSNKRNHNQADGIWNLICQRSTIIIFMIWALYPLLYYGTILITTTIVFTNNKSNHHNNHDSNLTSADETFLLSDYKTNHNNDTSSSTSSSLAIFDFNSIIITSLAEVLGTTILMFTIDSIGRIRSQIFSYGFGGLAMFLLCYSYNHGNDYNTDYHKWNNASSILLLLYAFIARASYKIGICTTWIITSEILPTHLRSTGHGFANSIARLSGALCPFIIMSQVRLSSSSSLYDLSSIGWMLFIISLIITVLVYQLPETKGQSIH